MNTYFLLIAILINSLLNNQLQAKTSCVAQTADPEYRLFVFSIHEKEEETCRLVFEKLRDDSKSVLYVHISGSELTVLCTMDVGKQHLIEYAEKVHLQLNLLKEEVQSKKVLSETLLKGDSSRVRSISRESFNRLPAAKQEHILSYPERYVIKD